MPKLRVLHIENCKLRSLPPGLVHHARSLKQLGIYEVQNLSAIENLLYLNELAVRENPNLERVAGLPKLQKLKVVFCPKLKVLENLPGLRSMILEDYDIDTLLPRRLTRSK